MKPVHILMARSRVSKNCLMVEVCFDGFVHFGSVPIYIFAFPFICLLLLCDGSLLTLHTLYILSYIYIYIYIIPYLQCMYTYIEYIYTLHILPFCTFKRKKINITSIEKYFPVIMSTLRYDLSKHCDYRWDISPEWDTFK